MKKALILVLAALMVPSVALAAKPSHHTKTPPQVTYRLSGTLSNYSPYDSVTPANGSITILVRHANKGLGGHPVPALRGKTLTLPVDANTKIFFAHGVTAIANGDRGGITLRAAKKIAPADLIATLQLSPARQIHDNGVKKPKP
jgi:hypothetical protein